MTALFSVIPLSYGYFPNLTNYCYIPVWKNSMCAKFQGPFNEKSNDYAKVLLNTVSQFPNSKRHAPATGEQT